MNTKHCEYSESDGGACYLCDAPVGEGCRLSNPLHATFDGLSLMNLRKDIAMLRKMSENLLMLVKSISFNDETCDCLQLFDNFASSGKAPTQAEFDKTFNWMKP